ncbi:hypothetical protein EV144_105413 [Flavobacterium sp. 270]|nr:hypothetical protein EV144_105413 [Flavobacterium sp. 270]
MTLKYYWVLLALFLPLSLLAGKLEGDYGDYTVRKYYIGFYHAGNWQLLDSTEVNVSGRFSISLPDSLRGSIVVVAADDRTPNNAFKDLHGDISVQFVYEGQDISYTTSWRNNSGYLKYGKGCEATTALKQLNETLAKVQERIYYIQKLQEGISPKDAFYTDLHNQYVTEVKKFNSLCDSVAGNFPKDSYMAIYAAMFKQVCPPKGLTLADTNKWISEHMFDYTSLHNPFTADIPLFKGMLQYYFYINQPVGVVPQEEIEQSKANAKEKLLAKSSGAVREVVNSQ